jgi:probable phosphoglycerate mutase
VSIFLIRHGETPGNAARIVQTPETPLSPRGIAQADRLARRLAAERVERILASDLRRAAMTAERVHAATGARVVHEPLLHERNFGELRGTAYADLDVDLFAEDLVPAGGESWSVFHERVTAAWAVIRAEAAATAGDLAVVTHGLVCHSLVRNHLQLARGATVPLRFGNTSVTIVEARAPWRAQRINCTAHLGDGDAADAANGAAL